MVDYRFVTTSQWWNGVRSAELRERRSEHDRVPKEAIHSRSERSSATQRVWSCGMDAA
jgi:hypothetical protein